MIRRAYRFLGLGFLILLPVMFALGYLLHPTPAAAVPNNEQLVKATSTLIDWFEHHDTEAMGYDFPTLLGCHTPTREWISDGLACDFGVTYLDESTRRYTVSMDLHNTPLYVNRSKRTVPLPSIP